MRLTVSILTFSLTRSVYASLGILDISALLQPNLLTNLFSSTDDKPHAPWSHEPHCTSTSQQQFCVYTSNTTGSYGLSFISTPTHASKAFKALRAHSSEASEETQDAPWEVRQILRKGQGVIATRDIPAYATVMRDSAALVIEKSTPQAMQTSLLDIAIRQLRQPDVVLELDTSAGGVVATNSFGTTFANTSSFAVFPNVSRINHACNPNAYVLFDLSGRGVSIRTYRAIEVGEEVTISYVPLSLPSAQRTSRLHKWGFKCTCALCALPPLEKKASDIRRSMISSISSRIPALAAKGDLDGAIALAEESVQLLGEEGLQMLLADEWAMLALLWAAKGQRVKAEVYARRGWELLGKLGHHEEGEFSFEGYVAGIQGKK